MQISHSVYQTIEEKQLSEGPISKKKKSSVSYPFKFEKKGSQKIFRKKVPDKNKPLKAEPKHRKKIRENSQPKINFGSIIPNRKENETGASTAS